MANPVVAFDESGNSGGNLLDEAQPVFVLASIYLPNKLAQALTAGSDELKFSKLRRSGKGRSKAIEVLNSEVWTEGSVLASVFHKEYMIVTKLVDLIIEPFVYSMGVDIYKKGGNIKASNEIYYYLLEEIGRTDFESILTAFVEMIREPSKSTRSNFFNLVRQANREAQSQLIESYTGLILGAEKLVKDEHQKHWDGSDLDPAVPAFVQQSATWTELLECEFEIIHDKSKPIRNEQLLLEAMMSTTEEQVQIGYDRRKMSFPVKATGIQMADSAKFAQIQLADVIAGAIASCSKNALFESMTSFHEELLATKAFQNDFFSVWPEPKFSPEELGTTETGGEDSINYTGRYVAQKLGGIPPKGERRKK